MNSAERGWPTGNDSGYNNQQQLGREFPSGRFPSPSLGNDSYQGGTTAWPPGSSNQHQLAVQVPEMVMQMSSARGSTAPPSEAGSYMTAASDVQTLQMQLHQSTQRVAQLERDLASMQTSPSINTASAFPFSNYGFNAEFC